ncbi:hypothetical protein [Effusibacillus consociatus]|uniref:FTP domain-containing protein n=1 Tax=Effusibacillus consociatus TaxID=1117041 RepID=A0ABV9Q912_9BACL
MRKSIVMGFLSALIFLGWCSQFAVAKELTGKERAVLQKLASESGGNLQIKWNEETNTPSYLSGQLSQPSKHSPEWIAYEFLDHVKSLYGMKNPNRTMKILKINRDENGSQVHMQHLVFNTPVWGDELVVTIDQAGIIRSVNGRFSPNLEDRLFNRPMKAAFSPQVAIEKARSSFDTKGTAAKEPTVEPYYLPTRNGTPLIYVVTLRFQEPEMGNWKIFVHSLTGKVIEKYKDES